MTAPSRVELAEPVPPRFWWLKRGVASVVVVVVALGGVRVWWGRVAQARLAAEFAAAHARGEPATFEDFSDPPRDPDDDANAANLITRAEGQFTITQAQQDWGYRWSSAVALTPADRTMLRAIVGGNARSLALLRRAVDAPAVNWGVTIRCPITAMAFPSLSGRRALCILLVKSFALSHDAGDDLTALVDLRAIVRGADAMEMDAPFLITHLMALGIQAMANGAIQRTAGSLRIDGNARPAAVGLLKQLCDESALRAGGKRQWYGERLYMVDAAENLGTTGVLPSSATVAAWPLQPMLMLDAVQIYRAESNLAALMDGLPWPTVRDRIPIQHVPTGSALDSTTTVMRSIASPSYLRPLQTHFHGLTDRRIAAVLLALRLYELDHGRLPTDLTELVPAYLPSVPIDPMSPDGHALRYIAAAGREAVYSVGEDSVDNGGSTTPIGGTGGTLRDDRWHQVDAVCPCHAPPPATQPGA